MARKRGGTMQEIIIDGVNVAECEYLEEDYFIYDLIGEKHLEHNKCMIISAYDDIITDCSQCPNCYFKQLQRLKAENEKLKKQLEINDEEDITVQISQNQLEEYTRLKANNEKLKECLRFVENNLTIIRHDFLTCTSECLAALEDESEVEQ